MTAKLNRFFAFLIKLTVSCFLLMSDAMAKQTVVWHVSHFPPANILNGEYKNEGFADKTRMYFQQELSDFSHEEKIVGFGDSIKASAEKISMCRADLLKTPAREKTLHYSKPLYFLSSRRLVVKREKMGLLQKYLSKKGEVEFSRFIESEGVRLSFVPGRAYFVEEPTAFTRYKQNNPQFCL